MEEQAISLSNPYPNGVPTEEENKLDPYINLLKEIRSKILNGEKVYIRINAGERKGSIAYIEKLNDAYQNNEPGYYRYRDWQTEKTMPSMLY
jgi:hypothetical protein